MLWSIALPAPRRGAKIFPGIAQALAPKSIPSFRADPESYLSSTDLPKPQRRISGPDYWLQQECPDFPGQCSKDQKQLEPSLAFKTMSTLLCPKCANPTPRVREA